MVICAFGRRVELRCRVTLRDNATRHKSNPLRKVCSCVFVVITREKRAQVDGKDSRGEEEARRSRLAWRIVDEAGRKRGEGERRVLENWAIVRVVRWLLEIKRHCLRVNSS